MFSRKPERPAGAERLRLARVTGGEAEPAAVAKMILHRLRQMTRAEQHAGEALAAQQLQQVFKKGPAADRQHRLGNGAGEFAEARATPAHENHGLGRGRHHKKQKLKKQKLEIGKSESRNGKQNRKLKYGKLKLI